MSLDKILKSLISENIISTEDFLSSISVEISSVNMRDYRKITSIFNNYKVDVATFFSKIYMNCNETVQYQMWKDGYVESCPVNKLVKDIVSENCEIVDIIRKDYKNELPHCEAYFENIQEKIIYNLSKATTSIKIAMAWFTNPIIFNSLLRICRKGINVDLLINNDLINNRLNGLPFNKLIQAGANLYIAEYPALIHNKFCIIDDSIVIDGSYNWTILAEKNNDENIVIIKNSKVIDSFVDAFDDLISSYENVDFMPERVPEKPEYDCCSYKNYNSEEWLEQLAKIVGKKNRYNIYKELFKILPEETAKEKIPKELFDSIKKDVFEEKHRDETLFHNSLQQKYIELEKTLAVKEGKLDSAKKSVETISSRKTKELDNYKRKQEIIKSKRIPQNQKSTLLQELRKQHRTKLNVINKDLSKKQSEIEILKAETNLIETQHKFVQSIKDVGLQGSNGLCRINLKWNTADDLDLHLVLPNGVFDGEKDVYYQNMKEEYNGGICTLDHDAIPDEAGENPQENIVWERKLPNGEYKVKVKLFNRKSKSNVIPFSISIYSQNGVVTDIFNFDSNTTDFIDIATLTFKDGKVVAPIIMNKS